MPTPQKKAVGFQSRPGCVTYSSIFQPLRALIFLFCSARASGESQHNVWICAGGAGLQSQFSGEADRSQRIFRVVLVSERVVSKIPSG